MFSVLRIWSTKYCDIPLLRESARTSIVTLLQYLEGLQLVVVLLYLSLDLAIDTGHHFELKNPLFHEIWVTKIN